MIKTKENNKWLVNAEPRNIAICGKRDGDDTSKEYVRWKKERRGEKERTYHFSCKGSILSKKRARIIKYSSIIFVWKK